MEHAIRVHFEHLSGDDRAVQTQAFFALIEITNKLVPWAYDIWDTLVQSLRHTDAHQRAIAAQILCNLAGSDPEGRILRDFDQLLEVTRDARFVTARHALQALWKVGLGGTPQQQLLVDSFERRFGECSAEKHCTLIRFDIIQGLRRLYDAVPNEEIKQTALRLIETETDLKYRKKYARVWNGVAGA